jgi:hypothetical protein
LFINRESTPEDYVGESWRNVLSLHLKAIDKTKFEAASEDQKSLRNFVIESFKIIYEYKRNKSTRIPKDAIKNTLNYITINIKVPSSSGHNIANSLNLEDLIK